MSNLELILRLSVAVIGYSVAIYYVIRAFIVATSMQTGNVPYVPASIRAIKQIGKLMELKKGDRFVDIGSGDGRGVFVLAQRHPDVEFTGIEIRRHLVNWSRFHVWIRRLKNVEIIHGDSTTVDLSKYNKVFMYMTPGFLKKMVATLEEQLKPGTIVLSLAFSYPKTFLNKHKKSLEVVALKALMREKVHIWRV